MDPRLSCWRKSEKHPLGVIVLISAALICGCQSGTNPLRLGQSTAKAQSVIEIAEMQTQDAGDASIETVSFHDEIDEQKSDDAEENADGDLEDDFGVVPTAPERPFDSTALAELLKEESSEDVDELDNEGDNDTDKHNDSKLNSTGAVISLEEAEQSSIAVHPDLIVARARVEAARGQYLQAGLPYNPTLQYQSDEIGNEDSTGLHSISVSQQFVTANKLGIAQQVQAQEIQRRQALVEVVRLQVLTRVRTRFITALVAQRRLELARQISDLAEKSLESVEALLEAEEVSRIALNQAKIEAQQAQLERANAETQLEASRRNLAAAMGVPQLRDAELAGQIDEVLTDTPWQTLLDDIVFNSPEIAEAASQAERSKWALQLACSQVVPNVTGRVGVGYDASSDDTYATIGVSVPLPIRNRNQGNIRTARATITQASATIDQKQLELASRLATAVGEYRQSLQQFKRLRDEILPLAEETYQLTKDAFDAGETSYLQLLTTQRTLFTTRISLLEAAASGKLASARIEGLLVDQLQNPS